MCRLWLFVPMMFLAVSAEAAALPDDVQAEDPAVRGYVDEAVEILRKHALNAGRVDWDAVSAEAHRMAAGARSKPAAYPAIRYLLRSLDDNHSFLQLRPELAAAETQAGSAQPAGASHDDGAEVGSRAASAFARRPGPEFAMLERPVAKIAYAFMPQGMRDDAFATSFQQALGEQHRAGACGWILDLRGNGGGNVWPMVAGLGPLLGDGEHGGSVGPGGRRYVTLYRDGAAILREPDGKEIVASRVAGDPVRLDPLPPVAVLIDRSTGSSGEMIAIAFHGRSQTRSFGERTYGASTSTEGFPLSDGANLVVATAVMADPAGKIFDAGLTPDESFPAPASRPDRADDVVLQRAAAWLEGTASCTASATNDALPATPHAYGGQGSRLQPRERQAASASSRDAARFTIGGG